MSAKARYTILGGEPMNLSFNACELKKLLANWEVTGANLIWHLACHFLGLSPSKKVLLVVRMKNVFLAAPSWQPCILRVFD
jgi:hypothetical protein